MSEALDFLRGRNTHEVKLESGLVVEIELQQLAEMIAHGDVPLPILDRMDKAVSRGEVPDLTPEELKQARTFKVRAVGGILRKIAEFDVAEDDREAAALQLSDSEFHELYSYAVRGKDPNQGEV